MKPETLNDLISKSKKFGADFHGTFNAKLFDAPKDTIVITGTLQKDQDEVLKEIDSLGLADKVKEVVFNNTENIEGENVGKFKANKIKEKELDLFLENDPMQVYWIKKYNPEANVIYINRLNYIIFSYTLDGFPYALRLKEEGNNVVMAILSPEDAGVEVKTDGEKEEEKRRNQIGDGLIKKFPAKLVFDFLKGFSGDKNEYFIDFDFNYGGEYGEKLEKMGYKGLFTRPLGRELEKDRQKSQEMVKEYFKKLVLPDEKEFKNTEEALNYIQKKQKIYVVKPDNPELTCFVPLSETFEEYLEEVQSLFNAEKAKLEEGFIIQEKIDKPVEVAPEVHYVNGEPVAFIAGIENKPIGSGNCGPQVGCTNDLAFIIDKDSKLIDIACKDYFPIAKKEKLNNFMDAAVLFDRVDETPYFSEFCSFRKGYNCFITEMAMLPSVSHYFESIKQGKNPFNTKLFQFEKKIKSFGASIRIFNLDQDENRFCKGETQIQIKGKDVWLWDGKIDKGQIVTTGQTKDVAVITGAGDTPEEAIQNAISNIQEITMKDMYYRNDIDSKEWFGLISRYNWLKENKYI